MRQLVLLKTIGVNEVAESCNEPSKDEGDKFRYDQEQLSAPVGKTGEVPWLLVSRYFPPWKTARSQSKALPVASPSSYQKQC
jgi:hypothetical protein